VKYEILEYMEGLKMDSENQSQAKTPQQELKDAS